MPRMGHANPRTYGKILKDSKREVAIVYSETTRKFDVPHYEATGEVVYLDEEEKDMPTVDQMANAKKLRKEITTIEQFEAIGNYKDVAIKYHVAIMTAHGLMRSLKAKKAKEETKMIESQEPVNCSPTLEEIETFHTDVEIPELPKVEFCIPLGELKYLREGSAEEVIRVERKALSSEELENLKIALSIPQGIDPQIEQEECLHGKPCAACSEVLSVTFCKECGDLIVPPGNSGLCVACSQNKEAVDTPLGKISTKTGRYICVDCGKGILDGVAVYAQSGLCQSCSKALAAEEKDCEPGVEDQISEEDFDRIMSKVELKWRAAPITKAQTIEELWKRLESTTCALHKMTIEQAERDFQKRLAGVVEGC